jgi:exopolysaccharide production protein ExoQ
MTAQRKICADAPPASVAERSFMVVVLLYSTGAFVNLFAGPDQLLDPGAGIPELRYVWAMIYALTFALWYSHCSGSLGVLLGEWPIVLLVGLAMVSVFWSDVPELTLRRSTALAGTCLIALYFAARYRLREQLKLLVWMCGISVVLSFVFGWCGWGTAVDDLEGAWIGIYVQRNALGSMMVLSALVFLLWARFDPAHRWRARGLAAAAFALIVLSRSMTAFVAFVFLLLLFPVVRRLARSAREVGVLLLLAGIALVAGGYWVAAHLAFVTESMGRDPGLTGRIELWVASGLMALERPWFGYGYNAFWLGLEGPSAGVWQIVGWTAPGSHNGLLEIWLNLGAVGVAIAVCGFSRYFKRAFRLIREVPAWESAWPLMFLAIVFILNLTENIFFGANNIYWLLYMVMALDLSRLVGTKTNRERTRSNTA